MTTFYYIKYWGRKSRLEKVFYSTIERELFYYTLSIAKQRTAKLYQVSFKNPEFSYDIIETPQKETKFNNLVL